jgi:hypothetical protein
VQTNPGLWIKTWALTIISRLPDNSEATLRYTTRHLRKEESHIIRVPQNVSDLRFPAPYTGSSPARDPGERKILDDPDLRAFVVIQVERCLAEFGTEDGNPARDWALAWYGGLKGRFDPVLDRQIKETLSRQLLTLMDLRKVEAKRERWRRWDRKRRQAQQPKYAAATADELAQTPNF